MRRLLMLSVFLLTLTVLVIPTMLGRLFGRQTVQPPELAEAGESLVVKVYFPESKEIQSIPLHEYLKGVVAAEMPADFETEALKAQMVAARTYTVRRMQQFVGPGKGGCPLNPEADVCADFNTSQAYTTKQELASRLQSEAAADALWKRLDLAETETSGLVLRYGGELIDPLYHAVSGRKTEDAAAYYNKSVPYLKSVSDAWGAYSPKLVKTQRLKPEAVAKMLGVKEPSPVVKIMEKTSSGRVKTIKVGEKSFTGREFREKLALSSTDFTVAQQNGELVITTYGDGHGVGMSQYGANGMAMEGKSYQEILKHYYTGIQISRIYDE